MDFETKKTELFSKAGELAHEFGADADVMIVFGDGRNIYTFASPGIQTILDKYKETENPPAVHHFEPEVQEAPQQNDLLRIQVEEMLQQSDLLRIQVAEIQDFFKSIGTLFRQSVHLAPLNATDRGPGTASNFVPQANANFPPAASNRGAGASRNVRPRSTSSAAPSATNSDPGTESIVQEILQENELLKIEVEEIHDFIKSMGKSFRPTVRLARLPSTSSAARIATNTDPGSANNVHEIRNVRPRLTSSAAPIATNGDPGTVGNVVSHAKTEAHELPN